MSALLEIRDLVVSFDGFRAIDGLDLDIEEGEVRFVIGPNGAGKTTLLDVITGLTRPASGSVRFGGKDLIGQREHKIVAAGIGRTFQTPSVFDALSVTDNLDLAVGYRRSWGALLRGADQVDARVETTLADIGLSGHAATLAGTLSHGQRQWLELGMLLVAQPRLLLLDEPVAGMTHEERERTGQMLERLAQDHTIVVIEHDMDFLRRFARKVTVMHQGKKLIEGSVTEVQDDARVREVYLGRDHAEEGVH